jgi:hypothetical protein
MSCIVDKISSPVIPALWRLRQEDLKFKVSLGYIVRVCLKKKKRFYITVHFEGYVSGMVAMRKSILVLR